MIMYNKAMKEAQQQNIYKNKRAHGEKIKQEVSYAKEEKM